MINPFQHIKTLTNEWDYTYNKWKVYMMYINPNEPNRKNNIKIIRDFENIIRNSKQLINKNYF